MRKSAQWQHPNVNADFPLKDVLYFRAAPAITHADERLP